MTGMQWLGFALLLGLFLAVCAVVVSLGDWDDLVILVVSLVAVLTFEALIFLGFFLMVGDPR